eukprot:1473842-Prymnesium_polylepis.2
MAMVERRSSVQDKARREEDLHKMRETGCRERFAYLPFWSAPVASHCVASCHVKGHVTSPSAVVSEHDHEAMKAAGHDARRVVRSGLRLR